MTPRTLSRPLGLLGAAWISGCAPEAPACADCGAAVIVMGADANILLPPLVRSTQGEQVSDLVFLKLADIGMGLNTVGDAGFQPKLARSWKRDDSLTWSFELDPRARWQDGKPVVAQDIAFTFSMYRDPLISANARPLIVTIDSVSARTERTAVFHFNRSYPEQFYDATYHMRILPRHILDSIPRNRLESHPFGRAPIGNGPYHFVAWKAGESLDLRADTTFFLGRPGLSRVVFRVTGDVNTAVTQIVGGQADLTEYIGGPDAVARVEAVPQFRVHTQGSGSYNFVGFNLRDGRNGSRPHPLFGDRDLRRALVQGLDRKALAQTILGVYARVPVGPASRMTPIGNDTTIAQLAYDTAAAKATLDRLGWRDANRDGVRERGGRRLEFQLLYPGSSGNRARAAVNIQQQLALIGVKVMPTPLEYNLFESRTVGHTFDAAVMGWVEDPSPAGVRQVWISDAYPGEANFGGYASPAFDRLVREASTTSDTAAARLKWREAYATINADAPAMWIYTPLQPSAIHRRYENVTIQPQQWLSTLWTWRVASGQMIERDRLGAQTAPAAASP